MRLFVAAVSLILCAPFAHAATTTVGTSNGGGNSFPLSYYSGEYQQVYSSAAFAAPVTITAISFTETPYSSTSISGNYAAYFSTTSKSVNGLSTTYADNKGADNALFASGVFTNSGNTLTLTASNPFTYNPAAGNLLLDFFDYSNSSSSRTIYFLNGAGPDTSRVYNPGGPAGSNTADNLGLQTTFTYTSAVSVTPEPSSFVLFGTGCTALIGLVRRRRQM